MRDTAELAVQVKDLLKQEGASQEEAVMALALADHFVKRNAYMTDIEKGRHLRHEAEADGS